MLDYLSIQASTENPTLVTIALTVLLSFLLSSLIAFTYEKTSRQVITPIMYLQSLILLSIVAATVMQAIGDSLARGLGMLGALAIIRFRTSLKTTRNMAFTFAALAVGISCGVYGFVIAIAGTFGFCLAAFILRFSSMSKMTNLTGVLKFDLPKSSSELVELEKILKQFCKRYAQVKFQIGNSKNKGAEIPPAEKLIAYEYQLNLKQLQEVGRLDTALSNLKTIRSIKLNFENSTENV